MVCSWTSPGKKKSCLSSQYAFITLSPKLTKTHVSKIVSERRKNKMRNIIAFLFSVREREEQAEELERGNNVEREIKVD